jgi:hypothetical protein
VTSIRLPGAPASAHADPASVLQRAWGEFRLDRLQQLVEETITFLNTIESDQLLGRTLTALERGFPDDPVAVALEACRAELREGCGMVDSEARRAHHGDLVRRHLADDPTWAATFREAFEKYRGLAGWMLELVCTAKRGDDGDGRSPFTRPY